MTIKRILCEPRLRRIPAQFSWVDPRLVFDGHLARLDVHAAALYLLLATVADSQGLSYWGDARVSQLLHTTRARLARSREDLVAFRLLAYEAPLYQVLALDAPASLPQALSPSSAGAPAPAPSPAPDTGATPDRAQALQRLAQLRARLMTPR